MKVFDRVTDNTVYNIKLIYIPYLPYIYIYENIYCLYSVSSGSINLQFRILEDLYRSLVIKVTYCYHSLSDFNQNICVASLGAGKLPDPWH